MWTSLKIFVIPLLVYFFLHFKLSFCYTLNFLFVLKGVSSTLNFFYSTLNFLFGWCIIHFKLSFLFRLLLAANPIPTLVIRPPCCHQETAISLSQASFKSSQTSFSLKFCEQSAKILFWGWSFANMKWFHLSMLQWSWVKRDVRNSKVKYWQTA